MDLHKRHSVVGGRGQFEQSSFTVFQPSHFNSSCEPDSLEDFDFEAAPTQSNFEDEPIPHSSGLTSHSLVTSYTSTTPILHRQSYKQIQQQQQIFTNTIQTDNNNIPNGGVQEEYRLSSIKTEDRSENTVRNSMIEEEEEGGRGGGELDSLKKNSEPIATLQSTISQPSSPVLLRSPSPIRLQQTTAPKVIKRPFRNYQLFPGRTRFFCGGRLLTSRDYWAFIVAIFLLVTPCVLFGIFT
jgi:hypothetical protein